MNIIILTYAKDAFRAASIDRLLEEARARGHTISRVRYLECSLTIEAGVTKVYYRGEEVRNIDAVIPWIIQSGFSYGMDVLRYFHNTGTFVLNSAEGFENACHKWRTAQVLAVKGIPTPDAYRAYEHIAMYPHIDNMANNESVIKLSTGTRGNGVMLSLDKATAKSAVDKLGVAQDDYIVQEFIRESYGVDVRAYVVGGHVIAAMERRANGDFRSNLSLGGKGVGVTLAEQDTQLVIEAASALGLNSAGIDFIRSDRGSLILEANTSGEFGIENATGANVAGKIIEYIERSVKLSNKNHEVGA